MKSKIKRKNSFLDPPPELNKDNDLNFYINTRTELTVISMMLMIQYFAPFPII